MMWHKSAVAPGFGDAVPVYGAYTGQEVGARRRRGAFEVPFRGPAVHVIWVMAPKHRM